MIRDGARVAFNGWPREHAPEIGDVGKVLSAGTNGSHVLWQSGARSGQVELVANEDLEVVTAGRDEMADSMETRVVALGVRDVFDTGGSVALLNTLAETGHLSGFGTIAEEALTSVASRLREDPSIADVLAHLEADEADEFVHLASAVLLRDAFGAEEGD